LAQIRDILARSRPYSFEFFPPKTDETARQLEATLRELEPLEPGFVSVTYGAGGSTRERTHDLVLSINDETSMTAMAHLTCTAHSEAELVEIVQRYEQSGIENILALGGDPPKDAATPPGELTYALELVELIRSVGEFSIGVAAYPQPHARATSLADDRARTAEKLAHADFAVTNFFFDPEQYFELIGALRERGIDKPVVPGVMPVLSIKATQRMAEMQGSEFPAWMLERLTANGDDPAAIREAGITEATRLCTTLLAAGAPGLHFYTLNGSTATREIVARLEKGPS
jgi:methylenetetrahydrofolate reductase (NADPH)